MTVRVLLALFVVALFLPISATAQTSPAITPHVSVGERIACQTAIEEVYWRHRTTGGENVAKASFGEVVPNELVQRKAEDAILQSLALERFWGVRIRGEQLQAELDRMVAHSKSPDILAELFAAVGNNPVLAAECLARPLLSDRLIQSYYASEERFHGQLKSRAQSELTAGAARNASGSYSEMEWHRGRDLISKPGVIRMEPATFDERIRELKKSVGGLTSKIVLGQFSPLREDSHRFYAVSVLRLDDANVRIATVEWPKVPYETWWTQTRQQLPLQLPTASYEYVLAPLAPNANCRDDSWKPTLQLVDPRYWHSAVWTGTEMIVWGGMSFVGVSYNDGTRYNPATDTYSPVATVGAPSARSNHSAVWTGTEMVIFGGTGDNTGGKYDPITDTWKATSTVGAPIGQQYSAAVWTGKEMIVWGGILFSPVNTGARYNPTTNKWKTLPPSPLAPRAYMPAVWTGTEMVVWAGYDVTIGQTYNDGARYNPKTNTWKLTNPASAPSARYWHSAIWTGTEMIVWGGLDYPVYDASGGRYNPATDTWTPTSLVDAPSLRWTHSAVWTGSVMVIQGGDGSDPVGGIYNPATDKWTRTNPVNAATNGEGATAVWTKKEMIIWGGLDGNFAFHNDGGRYNPSTDTWLHTTTMNVPQARGLHSGEWTGSEMVIWGSFYAVGGRYDPATDNWKTTSTVGAPPVRENATNVWTGTEVIFWGGEPDGNPFTPGSGGRYNPVTDSWKLVTQKKAPLTTYGHSAIWTGSEMIVYGGTSSSPNAKRYKPATDTWTDATMVNDPGHRDHHGAVWTGKEMIVWGGSIDSGYVGPEGGRYNPATDTWTSMSPSGLDQLRMWPVSVWSGTEAIFWGGHNQLFGQDYNDGARYNPVTNSWAQTNLANAPTPRVAQGVWTGKEMVVWGGANNSSGGRYNPASNSWLATTLSNAPGVRYGGRWSTVWTGNQMIIWGGIIETQSGGLYCASGQPNTAPLAADDAYTVKSAKKITFSNKLGVLVNDIDGNGDPLTAKLVTKTTHGTLTFNANGSFLYKSAKGFVGLDSFTYQANDGVANSNTATVNITVQ